MAFIAADSYHSTIASIAGGTGITSFTVTSASGFPALGSGDFTIMRLDDTGTAEDITVTAISGTTVTCLATTSAHANGNAIDGAILSTVSFNQFKDDAQSGFPTNALSGAGALVKGTGIRNHVTISSAATLTLADGTYTGECCRISMDRTSTAQATIDPASSTTWDGALTIALFAGDVIIGAWNGTGWITVDKYSSFATPIQSFIANNFYAAIGTNMAIGAVFSTTITRYTPFFIPYTITISQLGTNVTTLLNGGNFCMAIYANGTNNRPTGAPLQNTGNLSTTSAGVVMGALGANLQMTPGVYWAASQCDNTTATLIGVNTNASVGTTLVGTSTAANLMNGASQTVTGLSWESTSTYGTFASGPTITESNNTVSHQTIPFFKVASVP